MKIISCGGFNSRPSCDGRPLALELFFLLKVSIHARLATGDCIVVVFHIRDLVSIHARLATGDRLWRQSVDSAPVSIHARLATGDVYFAAAGIDEVFQFTPVLRRATCVRPCRAATASCFNSRPSCDGRPQIVWLPWPSVWFQFTPVLRRATVRDDRADGDADVSIHARLATGDQTRKRRRRPGTCFNSRPSCDGRPLCAAFSSADIPFQFTPVLRRATPARPTAPALSRCFNSRPSCDGRPVAPI